jgi:alpha-glucoside transport system permease protein
MNPALQGLLTIIVGVGGCIGYFFFSNQILDKVLSGHWRERRPEHQPRQHGSSLVVSGPGDFRAWPLSRLSGYRDTAAVADRSVTGWRFRRFCELQPDARRAEILGSHAQQYAVADRGACGVDCIRSACPRSSPTALLGAMPPKSLIFMPMAISFVGASVIFKLIYDSRPADTAQIGVLNALWMSFDGGFGSVFVLQILPTIILLSFAALVAYITYVFVRPVFQGDGDRSAALLPLRLLVLAGGAWLYGRSLTSSWASGPRLCPTASLSSG